VSLKGVNKERFSQIFLLNLGEALNNWFHFLDSQNINTKEGITKEFLAYN